MKWLDKEGRALDVENWAHPAYQIVEPEEARILIESADSSWMMKRLCATAMWISGEAQARITKLEDRLEACLKDAHEDRLNASMSIEVERIWKSKLRAARREMAEREVHMEAHIKRLLDADDKAWDMIYAAREALGRADG